MQDCFREHPDIYAEELEETEGDGDEHGLADEAKIADGNPSALNGTAADQPDVANHTASASTGSSKQEETNK
jgi:hypothetical protein